MLQIILAIVGVFYLIRRSKIKRISPAQFPDVPPAVFMEWRALELKGAHLFLWASAALFVWTTLVRITFGMLDAGSTVLLVAFVPTIVVFFICMRRSDVLARKADRLERLYGIKRPK